MKTIGISQKAILAFFFPLVAALAVAVIAWINGDVFDITGVKYAVGGLIASAVALLGAYVGNPGPVEPK